MTSVALDYETLTDIELAKLIAQRDSLAVRVVTRRNNQRLYRTAWSVLKDRADAEEAVQEGYLKGFAAIDSFAGVSSLSTPPAGAATLAGGPRSHLAGRSERRVPLCR
jgi:RNA polymerase sigma-70 factor, ECF subfamily